MRVKVNMSVPTTSISEFLQGVISYHHIQGTSRAFICLKSAIQTLGQGMKYIQGKQ